MPPCPTVPWHCQQPYLTKSALPFSAEAGERTHVPEQQAGGKRRQPQSDYEPIP